MQAHVLGQLGERKGRPDRYEKQGVSLCTMALGLPASRLGVGLTVVYQESGRRWRMEMRFRKETQQ